MEFEETEPQIMAPRVTPLEGVSTYALRGIGVRGVENPQGFGIDERRFAALYMHYSRSESHGKAIIESALQRRNLGRFYRFQIKKNRFMVKYWRQEFNI